MVTRKVKKHGETDFFHNYFNLKRCKDIIREKKNDYCTSNSPTFFTPSSFCFSPDTKKEVVKKIMRRKSTAATAPKPTQLGGREGEQQHKTDSDSKILSTLFRNIMSFYFLIYFFYTQLCFQTNFCRFIIKKLCATWNLNHKPSGLPNTGKIRCCHGVILHYT